MQLNGCNVQTQSPQGANSAIHPYALQFHGCAHYDVFNHTGFSHGWHALDHESDNFDDTWGVASVPTSLYGGQFGDCRKCTLSNVTNNFPAIMHDLNNIVYLDLHFTSGGGMAIAGFGHNVEGVVAAGGGNNTVLSFSRGAGGTRIWHCTFNNNLGQWGSGAHGMTRCNFGNLHYLTPPDTSAFTQCPHDTSNVFTNVDQATNGMPF